MSVRRLAACRCWPASVRRTPAPSLYQSLLPPPPPPPYTSPCVIGREGSCLCRPVPGSRHVSIMSLVTLPTAAAAPPQAPGPDRDAREEGRDPTTLSTCRVGARPLPAASCATLPTSAATTAPRALSPVAAPRERDRRAITRPFRLSTPRRLPSPHAGSHSCVSPLPPLRGSLCSPSCRPTLAERGCTCSLLRLLLDASAPPTGGLALPSSACSPTVACAPQTDHVACPHLRPQLVPLLCRRRRNNECGARSVGWGRDIGLF